MVWAVLVHEMLHAFLVIVAGPHEHSLEFRAAEEKLAAALGFEGLKEQFAKYAI